MGGRPIGLVGVGAMGRVLLKRLRSLGYDVQAFDVAEPARAAATQDGARVVASAADAARGATLIHVFVKRDGDAEDVIAAPSGILSGAAEGALILLHSTILPETVRKLAKAAAARRIDLLEAPVSGVPAVLAAGEARFLIGGDEPVLERAREHLMSLGKSVDYFGPHGAASVVKIVKAMFNAIERIALSEVLQVAAAGGVDLQQFLNFERETASTRCVSRWEHVFDIANNQARHRPMTNLMRKDIFLAEQIGVQHGLAIPVTHGAAETAKDWIQMWDRSPDLIRR